jgi:hypothetical protein
LPKNIRCSRSGKLFPTQAVPEFDVPALVSDQPARRGTTRPSGRRCPGTAPATFTGNASGPADDRTDFFFFSSARPHQAILAIAIRASIGQHLQNRKPEGTVPSTTLSLRASAGPACERSPSGRGAHVETRRSRRHSWPRRASVQEVCRRPLAGDDAVTRVHSRGGSRLCRRRSGEVQAGGGAGSGRARGARQPGGRCADATEAVTTRTVRRT